MTSGSVWFKMSFWAKFLEKTAVEDEIEYLLKEYTVSDFSRVDGEFELQLSDIFIDEILQLIFYLNLF